MAQRFSKFPLNIYGTTQLVFQLQPRLFQVFLNRYFHAHFPINLRTSCSHLYSTISSLVFKKNFDTITNMFRKTVLISIPFSCTPENTKKKKTILKREWFNSIRFQTDCWFWFILSCVLFCLARAVVVTGKRQIALQRQLQRQRGCCGCGYGCCCCCCCCGGRVKTHTRRNTSCRRQCWTRTRNTTDWTHCENRLSRIEQHALHATRGARASDAVDDCRAFGRLSASLRNCRAALASESRTSPRTNQDSRSRQRASSITSEGKFTEGKFPSTT